MTIAHVQSKTNRGSGDSLATAFDSSVTAGNLIVVAVATYNTTSGANTVSDGLGNTYTQISTQGTSGNGRLEVWYAKNITGGACTVTVNPPGASADIQVSIHEYSGLDTSSPLDVYETTTGSSTSPSAGPKTTTQNDELIFGSLTHITTGDPTINTGASFTQRTEQEESDAGMPIHTEDRTVSSTGSYSASWTTSPSTDWIAILATFKMVAAPASATPATPAPGTINPLRLPARWEIWADNPLGIRLQLLESIISAEITPVWNDVGRFQVALPASAYDWRLFQKDHLIEFWRAPAGGDLALRGIGRIRRPIWTEAENGADLLILEGPDQNDLLQTRVVAYAAGSAQADQTDYLDDMMKAVVAQNLGSLATDTTRTLSYLTVQGDHSAAPSKAKAFAHKNLLAVLQDLAETSRGAGTALYFGLAPVIRSDGGIGYEFRTMTNQPGVDRTGKVMFGKTLGNLRNARYEEDAEEEITFVYSGWQGQGSDRVVKTASDSTRIGESLFNRREKWIDAQGMTSETAAQNKADEELAKGRPGKRFSGQLLDTPQAVFGRDWDFGDRVTVEYLDMQFDVVVLAGPIRIDARGESIDARFEVVE